MTHKTSIRILTGIGVILLVLGMIYAIALAKSMAKLRRAYAALEKDGRLMRAAEVIPPVIADTENAAVLYESAASMLKAQPAGEKDLLGHLGGLAVSFVRGSLEPDKVPELKLLMEQEVVASALATIEQGTQRRACRFNRDYDAGFSMTMPMLSELRQLASILGVKACLEAEAGAPARAWATLQTQLKFADGLRDDPIFIDQLVRMGLIRGSCQTIQRVCEIAPPGREDGGALESLLRDLDAVTPLVRATDGERLLCGEWLFNLPKDELFATVWKQMGSDKDYVPEIVHWVRFRMATFKPRLIADHAVYLESMRKSAQWLERPYAPEGPNAQEEIWDLAKGYMLTNMLVPAVERMKVIHCEMIAEVHVTRAGLALLRHRQAHSVFPQTLDDLGLRKLTDPFTQEPLHYRVEGDGFVVYSMGEDLKDNGGSARQPKQRTDYDLVWRFPSLKGQTAVSER